jgi:hypothetical protein
VQLLIERAEMTFGEMLVNIKNFLTFKVFPFFSDVVFPFFVDVYNAFWQREDWLDINAFAVLLVIAMYFVVLVFVLVFLAIGGFLIFNFLRYNVLNTYFFLSNYSKNRDITWRKKYKIFMDKHDDVFLRKIQKYFDRWEEKEKQYELNGEPRTRKIFRMVFLVPIAYVVSCIVGFTIIFLAISIVPVVAAALMFAVFSLILFFS